MHYLQDNRRKSTASSRRREGGKARFADIDGQAASAVAESKAVRMQAKALRRLTAFTALLFVAHTALRAQFLYNETCTGTTGAFSTFEQAPGYTASFEPDDMPDNGWLRLTNNITWQNGYVLLDKSFPSSMGVTMEFDFKVWSKNLNALLGPADGFCVFLYNGAITNKDFQIGTSGGHLGYTSLKGAYLGVGIDEYGNFSNLMPGGPGVRKHAIAIADDKYKYVTGTTEKLGSLNLELAYMTNTPVRPTDAVIYRRVKIEMEPISSGTQTVGMTVTVSIKSTPNGTFAVVIPPTNITQTTPATLRMGFNASTGSGYAYHEVRNVVIRTPGAVSVFKAVPSDACAPSADNVVIHTIVANNTNVQIGNTAVAPILVRDVLPANYEFGVPVVSSNGEIVNSDGSAIAAFPALPVEVLADGSRVYEYYIRANAESYVYITYTGYFTTPPSNGKYVTKADITPPSTDATGAPFNDDTKDNHVVFTGCIYPATDDYATIFRNSFDNRIKVTNNDLIPCDDHTLTILTPTTPAGGTAVKQGDTVAVYTPQAGFLGLDSITYQIDCSDGTSGTAKVYINVVDKPDNISDEDCYIERPATVWDIQPMAVSDEMIHLLATPFAGDLDGDGHIEVVVPDSIGYPMTAQSILIFNDQLKLKHKITPPVSMPEYGTMTLLIADVDGDKKGEIVVAGTDRKLRCYAHNGAGASPKWTTTAQYSIVNNENDCPSLIAGDINGDGFVEILAVDKLYDGSTGNLLATLPTGGRGYSAGGPMSWMPVFADMDNDGIQEIVAGNTVYKIPSINRSSTTNAVSIMAQINLPDGFTAVADIDLDGDLDVIVTGGTNTANQAIMYVWDGETNAQIGNSPLFTSSGKRISRPFVGDMTGDGRPEIAFTYTNRMAAYEYIPGTNSFTNLWPTAVTSDASGATTMSMFDFNQDGEVELVYRDMTHLRIINRYGNNEYAIGCTSATHTEYPIVVDIDKDGHADILVSGGIDGYIGTRLIRFSSLTPNAWASARSVWNQHAYNAVNINEDLSVPKIPLNPTMVFPNGKRPYNGFLQQQTKLNKEGDPLWLVPDAIIDYANTSVSAVDSTVTVSVSIINQGAAPLERPVYVSLYGDVVDPAHLIGTIIEDIAIPVGGAGIVDTVIQNIKDPNGYWPFVNLIARINDKGDGTYPATDECDYADSVREVVNPALRQMMEKSAAIDGGITDNGVYANPVSVLFGETITYKITARNANLSSGDVIMTDTLPAYMDYKGAASHPVTAGKTSSVPQCDTIRMVASGRSPYEVVTFQFDAMPQPGVVASQPMFVNQAWVIVSDTLKVPTRNSTYHQGAGVSVVTFSAGLGGSIFNISTQALDYKTSPRNSALIAPDSGYVFAGWSHDEYTSLRGQTIAARAGIMSLDTLIVYGNVELRANFISEDEVARYNVSETEEKEIEADRIWSSGETLYVQAVNAGSIVRIYAASGTLLRQQTLLSGGEATFRLLPGVYIVTLNNGAGQKVVSR